MIIIQLFSSKKNPKVKTSLSPLLPPHPLPPVFHLCFHPIHSPMFYSKPTQNLNFCKSLLWEQVVKKKHILFQDTLNKMNTERSSKIVRILQVKYSNNIYSIYIFNGFWEKICFNILTIMKKTENIKDILSLVLNTY